MSTYQKLLRSLEARFLVFFTGLVFCTIKEIFSYLIDDEKTLLRLIPISGIVYILLGTFELFLPFGTNNPLNKFCSLKN